MPAATATAGRRSTISAGVAPPPQRMSMLPVDVPIMVDAYGNLFYDDSATFATPRMPMVQPQEMEYVPAAPQHINTPLRVNDRRASVKLRAARRSHSMSARSSTCSS
eukprot:555322_1